MKIRFKYIIAVLLMISGNIAFSQQVKKAVTGTFLLKNGTIHTVTKGVVNGDVLIQNGIITDVGASILSDGATIIDCRGKHIYPGMIDAGCRLGLAEIGSISLTNDYNEIGDFKPHIKALTAVNPNSVSIPVTRVNGVTTVFSKPQGGTFPGTGAVINLFGYSPEQMFTGAEGVIMQFPATGRRHRWDKRTDEEINKETEKAMMKINEIWDEVMTYQKIDSASIASKQIWAINNPQMQALIPVASGQAPLFIEVNAKNDIEEALKWVAEKKIKAVFMGVSEGWRIADQIAKAGIPVITGPILDIPSRDNNRYDVAYANAGKMVKAGVKVALRTNEAENVRNLPFNAGFAAAYGLGIEEALKTVTINPAEIFGIDKHYGSIEKGKIANIIITDGDPFETKTQIERLFIRGWDVPIESRQTLLYDEFLDRTPGIK